MAMFRRSRKSSPPLRRRQEEIARQEAELRERLEKLERLVAKVPVIEKNRAKQEVNDSRYNRRFSVSVAADGRDSTGDGRSGRRPRSLRKERREGQIIFLLLVVALAVAVIWLISNLHS
jgi:DNA-binding protein H-NS